MTGRLLTCGDHALLVELDGLEEVLALYATIRTAVEARDPTLPELVDLVPAARTLLLVVASAADVLRLRSVLPPLMASGLTRGPVNGSSESEAPVVEIVVHYDGADLDEVADLTGLSPTEVVAAHTGTPWRVAFAGFAPGFAYLVGGDPRLEVPRRSEPRTSVPAGSVALAGEFSAVYPRSSPGGWQLIGHTDAILFDVDRQPPALLQPGAVARFLDADQIASR